MFAYLSSFHFAANSCPVCLLTVDENLCLLSFSSADSTHTQIERKSSLIRCTLLLFTPLHESRILQTILYVHCITAKASHYISNAILLSDKNTHLLHIWYRHCFDYLYIMCVVLHAVYLVHEDVGMRFAVCYSACFNDFIIQRETHVYTSHLVHNTR